MSGIRLSRNSVVLASGSATRRAMLEAAGLEIVADAPDLDEGVVKRACRVRGEDAAGAAKALAAAKAQQVQTRHPGRIVLGADQMLDCDGEWFDKPGDRAAAKHQLATLSGRTHRLVSAVAAFRDGLQFWSTADTASLTMRPLSQSFIDAYLDAVGDRALSSVGGYQIEGPGIQLFDRIQGDHFTILGLPLLPLLGFLRAEGVLSA